MRERVGEFTRRVILSKAARLILIGFAIGYVSGSHGERNKVNDVAGSVANIVTHGPRTFIADRLGDASKWTNPGPAPKN